MMTNQYRVNFGNGQVQDVKSKADGIRMIVDLGDSHAYLQRYDAGTADDPGMWVRVKFNGRRG